MEPLYDAKAVEARWQRAWEEEGLYNAEPDAEGESVVIMHPPPNISGSLTIGHCLQLSLEDTLVRWHRMRGFNTLFQPGYDHAGISTWAAIGRTLGQEGRSQRDLGREGFDAYVQEWLRPSGGTLLRPCSPPRPPTAQAPARSRRGGRRRSSPTSRSQSIPRTSVTAISSARRSSFRSS